MQSSEELNRLIQRILQFRDARDLAQFHTLKNLAAALSVECGELLELTQWRDATELDEAIAAGSMKSELNDEIADVFIYLLLICEKAKIDPIQAASEKIAVNEKRYPPSEFRGSSRKYSA